MTNKKKKGFTLIELIVVIAILGILAAVLIPKFSGFTSKAKGSQALVNAKQIATAIDGLEAEGKTYLAAGGAGHYTLADVQTVAQITPALQAVATVDSYCAITAMSGTDKCSSFTFKNIVSTTETHQVVRNADGTFTQTP